MNTNHKVMQVGLPLSALFLVACGGAPDATDEVGDVRAQPTSILLPPPIFPPPPVPVVSPKINAAPQDAIVGRGAGVRFSVSVGGFSPFTYRWYKDGGVIAGAGASLTIPAAAPASAGTYMVQVTDKFGHTASASARLQVVTGWARLSGRGVATTAAAQQPSLTACGQPHVAYVHTPAGGRATLHVLSFDGAAWIPKGGALNATSDGSASDPSIACVGDAAGARPVVAWSEGDPNTRNIFVRYWDGSAWQSNSAALNITPGSKAEKPVLRVPPYDPNVGNVTVSGITRRAAIAWIENGRPTVRRWDGSWQALAGGSQMPGAVNARDLALRIDLEYGNQYPPVVAWLQEEAGNLRPFASIYTTSPGGGAWTLLGTPASFGNPPPVAAAGRIGIATGKLGSPALAVPVVVWAEGSSTFTVRSFFYTGINYLNLIVGQPWPAYGSFGAPVALKSASLDGNELPRLACASGAVPSFGLAVGDGNGFEVRRGDCAPSPGVNWIAARPRNNTPLEELSLRMNGPNDPLVAGTRLVNGSRELSVWKYYD